MINLIKLAKIRSQAEEAAYSENYSIGFDLMEDYLRLSGFYSGNRKIPAKALILASVFSYRVGAYEGSFNIMNTLLNSGERPWSGVAMATKCYLMQYSAELLEYGASNVSDIEQGKFLDLANKFYESVVSYNIKDVSKEVRGLYPLSGAY